MKKKSEKNNISVTILGSGTCVPSLDRSACSFMVCADDKVLVFDAGPGTMRRLLETGFSILDVSHLFFSHFHPDHTGELVPFLFASKYPENRRRNRELTVCGGPGFTNFFNQLQTVYKEWIDVGGLLTIIELNPAQKDAVSFNDVCVYTTSVAHRPESIAFKVTVANGTSIVYSGDTDYSENLIELSQNTDLLICESALPDPMKAPGHLTPSSAGKIADRANVKKLVLTHFYPECDGPEIGPAEIRRQCRTTYSGPLILAEDLLTIPVDTE